MKIFSCFGICVEAISGFLLFFCNLVLWKKRENGIIESQRITEDKKMKLGKELTLMQNAYISDNGQNYQAIAEDVEGNSYKIVWEILESYNPEEQEEDEACDWEDYEIIEL